MYLAELRGKLSSRVERMEDILTSNVFSFFKYSNRDIFLKGYLNELGFIVSDKEEEEAEFKFWPVFDDGAEPDLVIIVGKEIVKSVPERYDPERYGAATRSISEIRDLPM
jgi:hypothetical protein